MAKAGFYAVARGRVPGIYASWEDCEPQLKGYSGARYKRFKTLREAEEFVSAPCAPSTFTSTSVSTIASASSLAMSAGNIQKITSALKAANGAQVARSAKTSKPDVASDDRAREEGYDVVYTDGACKSNGQESSLAGIGIWWGHYDPRNIAERCPGTQTNNRAELIAIARVLEQTLSYCRPLIIKTDSTYSIKCLRDWHQGWENRGWKTSSGKPVLSAPLIRYILALLELRDVRGFPAKLVHVRGHAGIEGNEGADFQATVGAVLGEREERDWEEERMVVEEMIREWRDGVEVMDKAVQVEIEGEEGTEELMEEPDLEPAPESNVNDQAPASVSATEIPKKTKSEPVSTIPALRKENGETKPSASAPAAVNGTLAEPQTQPAPSVTNGNSHVQDEFSIDDLLSPEELEAELAKELKS